MNEYTKLFSDLHKPLIPYYSYWCHDEPMLISRERDDELKRYQNLLYRCIEFYIENYEDYLDIIDYDEPVLEILELSKQNPFRAGTYRPDFLIDRDNNIKFCEISSRFFGNGYFMSYFIDKAALDKATAAGVSDYYSYFESFLEYTARMLEGRDKVRVLKSSDKSDSIRLYVPFYQALGADVEIFEADEVEKNIETIRNSLVLSALNQTDLLSFSMDTIKRMIDEQFRNDFRTVFLVHDKRFFKLFFMDDFTKKFLTDEETSFLREHSVETFIPKIDREIFEDAKVNKDKYILKHARLGKSERVYPGPLTTPGVWERLFQTPEMIDNMILQPFVEQKTYPTLWNGEKLEDYACGTILTVDDKYFGPGLFRTSTRPVVNQTNAHKIAPLISDQIEKFRRPHIL